MESEASTQGPAPKQEDPRPQFYLAIGERQYLIAKLAGEISVLTAKLDEMNKKAQQEAVAPVQMSKKRKTKA